MPHRKVYLTDKDLRRLKRLLGHNHEGRDLQPLLDGLDRATVVPEELIPPNVVTMNSRVRFMDLNTHEESEATVVYPERASEEKGRVSVLKPVGAALLGLSVGDTVAWPLPGGGEKNLRILEVLYQPEAEGHWDL